METNNNQSDEMTYQNNLTEDLGKILAKLKQGGYDNFSTQGVDLLNSINNFTALKYYILCKLGYYDVDPGLLKDISDYLSDTGKPNSMRLSNTNFTLLCKNYMDHIDIIEKISTEYNYYTKYPDRIRLKLLYLHMLNKLLSMGASELSHEKISSIHALTGSITSRLNTQLDFLQPDENEHLKNINRKINYPFTCLIDELFSKLEPILLKHLHRFYSVLTLQEPNAETLYYLCHTYIVYSMLIQAYSNCHRNSIEKGILLYKLRAIIQEGTEKNITPRLTVDHEITLDNLSEYLLKKGISALYTLSETDEDHIPEHFIDLPESLKNLSVETVQQVAHIGYSATRAAKPITEKVTATVSTMTTDLQEKLVPTAKGAASAVTSFWKKTVKNVSNFGKEQPPDLNDDDDFGFNKI